MPFTGRDDRRVGLLEQYLRELERIARGARVREDARVGTDSHHTAENLRGNTIRCRTVDHGLEPRFVLAVSF